MSRLAILFWAITNIFFVVIFCAAYLIDVEKQFAFNLFMILAVSSMLNGIAFYREHRLTRRYGETNVLHDELKAAIDHASKVRRNKLTIGKQVIGKWISNHW